MNANSVNPIKNHRTIRQMEIVAYALLAIFLIGHIFFVDNLVSSINILLLTLGTIFGMMTTFAWASFTAQINNPVVLNLAELLPFNNKHKKNEKNNTDEMHAA